MPVREAEKGVIRGDVGIACVALLALVVRGRAMVAVLHADSSFRHQRVAGALPGRHHEHMQQNKIRKCMAYQRRMKASYIAYLIRRSQLASFGSRLPIDAACMRK